MSRWTCRTGGTVPMTTANRLTTAGMRGAAGKGVTGACVGTANHVACAHCVTWAGGHGNTSTHRVARTGAATFRCTFIGLHDVHFLIRNFDVHRIQNLGIPIGFPIFLQAIVGSVLHILYLLCFLKIIFYHRFSQNNTEFWFQWKLQALVTCHWLNKENQYELFTSNQ